MSIKGLVFFFKFSTGLAVMCVITAFLTIPNSAEFYITIISLVFAVVLSLVSAVLIRKKRKKEIYESVNEENKNNNI